MTDKNRIKSYRALTGMNQAEMARALGISKQAYFNKENTNTQFTDVEKVKFTELVNEQLDESKRVTLLDIFF